MAQTITHDMAAASDAKAGVPWHIWAGVVAVSSIMFGLYWDISWHETIGRDTFWTPAHLAIHFGGILAAITCTYLIFSTTFGHDAAARGTSATLERLPGFSMVMTWPEALPIHLPPINWPLGW